MSKTPIQGRKPTWRYRCPDSTARWCKTPHKPREESEVKGGKHRSKFSRDLSRRHRHNEAGRRAISFFHNVTVRDLPPSPFSVSSPKTGFLSYSSVTQHLVPARRFHIPEISPKRWQLGACSWDRLPSSVDSRKLAFTRYYCPGKKNIMVSRERQPRGTASSKVGAMKS